MKRSALSNRPRRLSLRTTILLMLLVVVGAYALISQSILRAAILPTFARIEREQLRADLARITAALDNEIEHLSALCRDWSAWDDTYRFVADANNGYRESNLVDSTFRDNKLNVLLIIDQQGNLVWGRTADYRSGETIPMPPFSEKRRWESDDPLLSVLGNVNHPGRESIDGVYASITGPLILASRPVLTSNGEGPPRGAVIMGRSLDDAVIEKIQNQSGVPFQAWSANDPGLSPEDREAFANLSAPRSNHIVVTNGFMHGYTSFPDVGGKEPLLIRVDLPRTILAGGVAAVYYSVISLLVAGAVVLFVLHYLLTRTVIAPLERLTTHTKELRTSGDFRKQLPIDSPNEIGTLGREFNMMAGSLWDARKRLLQQTYGSTVTRHASRIVHDIRNSLAPLVSQIETIEAVMESWPSGNVRKALTELGEDETEDARRHDLERFVTIAADRFVTGSANIRSSISVVHEQVRRIESILVHQEKVTTPSQVGESISLQEILPDAVATIPASLTPWVTVELDPGLAATPPVAVIRPLAVHVFGDLIASCAASLAARDDSPRNVVSLRASLEENNDNGVVHVEIGERHTDRADSERVNGIFERGYAQTSPAVAHVDLHDCANIIIAMNGTIYAEKETGGDGLSFHVLLPATEPRK